MRHARLWLTSSTLVVFLLGAGLARPQEAPAESGLSVRYLANEGFLLRANGRSVLIDAFVGAPYHEYAALPPELLAQLTTAKSPFDAIDLALTSHVHRDHFQADVACAFLTADLDAPFWSAEQVIDALKQHCAELPGTTARLRPIRCETGKTVAAELGDLSVESFPLFHVKDIQNLAHLVRFKDGLVLHVGDAQLDREEYAPYELGKRKIDVALLPFWYFLDEQDCASVREWIGAKHYVAMHVPPRDFADVRKRIAANMPGVLMLEKGGDAVRLPLGAETPAK
jgi:L-ascorbate metabolism protein UlaG (beta-lactamase superfamily)